MRSLPMLVNHVTINRKLREGEIQEILGRTRDQLIEIGAASPLIARKYEAITVRIATETFRLQARTIHRYHTALRVRPPAMEL
jgi:hypothetical protein